MRRLVHETRRLVLRPLRRSDYAVWFDAYTGGLPKMNKWDIDPYPVKKCSRVDFEKVRARHARLAREDKCYIYAAFYRGEMVGAIDLSIYDRKTLGFANFGYRLFNRHWGKGFGQEMARGGLHIGLQVLRLQRLEAAIDLDNRRSIKLVKSLRMEREGIKKEYWFQDGRWDDQLVYVARPCHLKGFAQKS